MEKDSEHYGDKFQQKSKYVRNRMPQHVLEVEACNHEVGNCQLFILLIGGRFGGEYIADKSKSITNAEYLAARENNIPVFTYIRGNVLSNHHIYLQNRKKDFIQSIDFPAIEKQEHAIDIFNFINDVRRSPTNNAFEGFGDFQDIENHLRKQWAWGVKDTPISASLF